LQLAAGFGIDGGAALDQRRDVGLAVHGIEVDHHLGVAGDAGSGGCEQWIDLGQEQFAGKEQARQLSAGVGEGGAPGVGLVACERTDRLRDLVALWGTQARAHGSRRRGALDIDAALPHQRDADAVSGGIEQQRQVIFVTAADRRLHQAGVDLMSPDARAQQPVERAMDGGHVVAPDHAAGLAAAADRDLRLHEPRPATGKRRHRRRGPDDDAKGNSNARCAKQRLAVGFGQQHR
jgi:hypothetical protein